MTKYKITEKDNTGVQTLGAQPNIVYIPGAVEGSEKLQPKLYKNAKDLITDSNAENTTLKGGSYYSADDSLFLAIRLLNLGMQVLYQGFPKVGSTSTVTPGEGSSTFRIPENTGTIYTYTNSTGAITWTDSASVTHSSKVDGNGVAELDGGLVVKYTATTVYYPVAVRQFVSDIDNEGKFYIKDIEFTIGDNQVSYTDSSSTPHTVQGINGMFTITAGFDSPFELLVNYVDKKAYYDDVYILEGSINITPNDWKALEDKNLYNVRFLTTGAYPENISTDIITCAANRGDCVALIDHENFETYSVSAVRSAIEALKDAPSQKQSDPLSFAAAFTPWFTASLQNTTGHTVLHEVPASFGYLLAYARSVQANPMWKAVAGIDRGIIPELVDVNYVLNNAECEVLQARATTGEVDLDDEGDNAGIAINPIAYRRSSRFAGGFNYVINGNRTMHVNDGTTKATSFMNVRVLVSEISKTLYDASVASSFEPNDDILWFNFTSLVTPTLNRMKSGEGIDDYRFIREETNKLARVKASLYITPIEGVEDFELGIVMEDSLEITE